MIEFPRWARVGEEKEKTNCSDQLTSDHNGPKGLWTLGAACAYVTDALAAEYTKPTWCQAPSVTAGSATVHVRYVVPVAMLAVKPPLVGKEKETVCFVGPLLPNARRPDTPGASTVPFTVTGAATRTHAANVNAVLGKLERYGTGSAEPEHGGDWVEKTGGCK